MNQTALRNQLLPLEKIVLPPELSGYEGSNRSPQSECQVDAANDLAAIHCWLAEFDDSPETFRSYQRESERLLLWSIMQLNKPISSLNRSDFKLYELFLFDPQPRDLWCGPRTQRDDPLWKPFTGELSKNSRRQSLVIINSLLSYCVDAGYIKGNPLALIRRRNKKLQPDVQPANYINRYLDQQCWNYVKEYLSNLYTTKPQEQAYVHRLQLLFRLLYILALRISEVTTLKMNSFREYRGHWWCFVVGKGEKQAKIPVNNELLDAVCSYRQYLGLTPFPAPDDDSPLLRRMRGDSSISANMVHRLVKRVFNDVANHVEVEDALRAKTLRQASTHWIRHASISHQDDAGIGLKYLKQNARHSKIETTTIYQHADDELWHKEMSKHSF